MSARSAGSGQDSAIIDRRGMRNRGIMVAAFALAGCGRISFDPIGDADTLPPGGPLGRIPNPSGIADEQFGHQVAISDAGNTIVIAARASDAAAIDGGAAYVFVAGETEWTLQATLVASVPDVNDQIGVSI